MVYKKGISPVGMVIFFVFATFFVLFVFGVIYYATEKIDESFDGITGLTVGDVDFHTTYQETIQPGFSAILRTLSTVALGTILGMIVVMLIMGYKLQENRLWILFDIFIILVAFIVAVYISQSFDTVISSNGEFFEIYSGQFSLPSRFLLNLPIYIPIIGIFIMLATYATKKRREPNVFEAPG